MKKELMELQVEMQQESSKDRRNGEDPYLESKGLQLLMNKKITSFHFPPDLTGSGVTATKLWQSLVAEQPPDLHTIICNCTKNKRWDVEPFFDSLLPLFPNLEVLWLANFYCSDQELIKIADHLPKLRSVLFFILFFQSQKLPKCVCQYINEKSAN
jgi:hypothetical protein